MLIADDEIEILELQNTFLQGKVRAAITATNGRKCIGACKGFNLNGHGNYFDLVILDQKMPFMTGLETAVEILDITPDQKITFASGHIEKTLLKVLTRLSKASA